MTDTRAITPVKRRRSPAAREQASTRAPANKTRSWLTKLAPAAALAAIVAVAYMPVSRAQLIWDDGENVTTNETLRSWDGLRQMWLIPQSIQQYYPLMYTTYWVEYHLWGLDPLGYHLVNVALHAAASVLVWRLLVRLRVPGAWLAAVLFAVHPVAVESVAWVTERKNVLSLCLALSSMLAYFRFTLPEDAPQNAAMPARRWLWYGLAIVLFAMSLFAKTVVVTLPAVLLVIYWWQRGRLSWRDAAPLVPFVLLSLILGLVTMWMETHHVGAQGDDWSLTFLERFLLAGRALWFYLGKLLWPRPLVFLYPRWQIDSHSWWQYLFPAAALLWPLALWLVRHKIGRGPLAAVLIYSGVLVPALGFFNIYFTRYAQVADHFQYHASVALFALVGAAAARVTAGLRTDAYRIAATCMALVLIVLGTLTYRQTFVYRDLVTLLSDIIDQNPQNWMPYANLAEHRDAEGRYDDAAQLLRTCIALCQDQGITGTRLFDVERKLGFVLMEAGQFDDANIQFAKALDLRPFDWRVLYGQGMALASLDRWSEAMLRFEKALSADPNYAEGHYGLALALRHQGDPDEAFDHFQKAVQLDPTDPLSHFELANMLALRGNLREAAGHYAQTVRSRPEHADAWHNLGVLTKDLGDPDKAIEYLREALRRNPANANTKISLDQAIEASRRLPFK
jgi:protein O-mannosyl-transferase